MKLKIQTHFHVYHSSKRATCNDQQIWMEMVLKLIQEPVRERFGAYLRYFHGTLINFNAYKKKGLGRKTKSQKYFNSNYVNAKIHDLNSTDDIDTLICVLFSTTFFFFF